METLSCLTNFKERHMSENYQCWHCGNPLAELILPMSRREECSGCTKDQHVCKMCVFYDGARGCNEEQAEDVSDIERANFCDYFKPKPDTFTPPVKNKSTAAKAKLAELFGDPLPEQDTSNQGLTPAELAEKKLREMLGGF
jgi:hypothetical protein